MEMYPKQQETTRCVYHIISVRNVLQFIHNEYKITESMHECKSELAPCVRVVLSRDTPQELQDHFDAYFALHQLQ